MMRDYKFRRRDDGFDRKPKPRRMVQIGLVAIAAGAGYALFQILNPNPVTLSNARHSGQSEVIELPLPDNLTPVGPSPDIKLPRGQIRQQPRGSEPGARPVEPRGSANVKESTALDNFAIQGAMTADIGLPDNPAQKPTSANTPSTVLLNEQEPSNAPGAGPNPAIAVLPSLKRGPFRLDYKMQPGDTLGSVFQSQGLPPDVLYQVLNQLEKANRRRLTQLHAGETIHIHLNEALDLERLEVKLDATKQLLVSRNGDEVKANIQSSPTERRRQCLTAVVDRSLYGAAQNAGIPRDITTKAINLFRQRINFAKQTRKGDHLSVLFEQVFADEQAINTGAMLAVQITNGNKDYSAVRYTNSRGVTDYYSADGEPINKSRNSFLRAPLKYTRVSSPFSSQRLHPILRRVRPHTGVDLAAPAGRRIVASASGRVTFKGRKGGYGNLLILRHGSHYETRYAHLLRFATGLSDGDQVQQGETIGYVGQSGLATGPHLHYEIRMDGKPINPLAAKLPFIETLDDKEKIRFFRQTRPLLAELERSQSANLLVDNRWNQNGEASSATDSTYIQ